MGCAEFIKKHFVGKELCVSVSDSEMETLVFDQHWLVNREYFQGIVEDVDCGIIVLEIFGKGKLYINEDMVSFFWEKPLNPYKILRTALSKKLHGIGENL